MVEITIQDIMENHGNVGNMKKLECCPCNQVKHVAYASDLSKKCFDLFLTFNFKYTLDTWF